MVREHMPLQASQKRISWSYEPVTRMTDMSWRGGAALVAAADWDGILDGLGAGWAASRRQAEAARSGCCRVPGGAGLSQRNVSDRRKVLARAVSLAAGVPHHALFPRT